MQGSELVSLSLLERVCGGDPLAWHEFWRAIEGTVAQICRSPHVVGPLARREDDRHNVELAIVERLREQGFRRLRSYIEARAAGRAGSFEAWLRTVASRVAIDCVRAHPECIDPRGRGGGDRWVRFVPNWPIVEGAGPRADTLAQAAQLLELAQKVCSPLQLDVLQRWLAGSTRVEIAVELGTSDADVHRALRAGLKRLRDRFAPKQEEAKP